MNYLVHIPRGIILPESVLLSDWFAVLASFVAINTVLYLVLGMVKLLPVIRLSRSRGQERRSETRSIYPETSA